MKMMFRSPELIPIESNSGSLPLSSGRHQDRLRGSLAVPLILSLSLMLWSALSLLMTGL